MKDKDKKIRAAISAAVAAYIAGQEEMAVMSELAAAAKGSSALERAPFDAENNWGVQGRVAQMQNRAMMQLKAFYR